MKIYQMIYFMKERLMMVEIKVLIAIITMKKIMKIKIN